MKARFALALAVVAALAVAVPAAADDGRDDDEAVPVAVNDACDPVTFNAAIGPGTCVGAGTVTFGAFIAELTATHTVATWNFAPSSLTIENGDIPRAGSDAGRSHDGEEAAPDDRNAPVRVRDPSLDAGESRRPSRRRRLAKTATSPGSRGARPRDPATPAPAAPTGVPRRRLRSR